MPSPVKLRSTDAARIVSRRASLLRRFLIAGILVAIAITVAARLYQDRTLAVWHLRAAGARVSYFKDSYCVCRLPNDQDAKEILRASAGDLSSISIRYELQLDLDKTNISDDDLLELAAIRGRLRLSLVSTSITDKGLDHLKQIRSLEHVNLCDTSVTRQGVRRLKRALPACEITWLPPGAQQAETVPIN